MDRKPLVTMFLLALAVGCGTVVGNPKKPSGGGGTTPEPSAIVYALPATGFTVPDGLLGDNTTLALADTPVGTGDRSVLFTWSRRLKNIVKQIDGVSATVTRVAKAERDAQNDGDILVFKNRGADGKLSGRLQPLPPGGTYAYQAVVCQDGKLFEDFRWSADGTQIELTRDFSELPDGADAAFPIVSKVVVNRGGPTTQIDVTSVGTVNDPEVPTLNGSALSERSFAEARPGGEVVLRMVADRDAAVPTDDEHFRGDMYLVGRVDASGQQEFVDYYKGFKACAAGFDEAAADLWHPDFTGPRFCEGRPLGGKKFLTRAGFDATLSDLEPIGIEKKADLHLVTFEDGLACD